MVDIKSTPGNDSHENALSFGNKLSVLGGDFLLAKASIELGKLGNTDVVELMSRAIGHLAEGATVEKTSPDNNNSLNWCLEDWEQFVFLLKGSLLANSCEAAVTLMGHGQEIRGNAFTFGSNLVLAQQCIEDVENFHNKKTFLQVNNLLLVLALQQSNMLRHNYVNYSNHSTSIKSSRELRNEIVELCPDIVTFTKNLCEEKYIQKCKESVSGFQVKTSISAIENILRTVCD